MSSVSPFIEGLILCKSCRMDFEDAWTQVTQVCRPRMRDVAGLRGDRRDGRLDQTDVEAMTWFKRVCRDAYEDRPSIVTGGPSRLRSIRGLNLDDTGGRFARRSSRRAVA